MPSEAPTPLVRVANRSLLYLWPNMVYTQHKPRLSAVGKFPREAYSHPMSRGAEWDEMAELQDSSVAGTWTSKETDTG